MSSIYRKGRDGYFYYQTYVYNKESKKKDKRIFHALRTKDLREAEEKQIQLDIKYEQRSKKEFNLLWTSSNLFRKRTIAIILTTIAITILVSDYFITDTTNNQKGQLKTIGKVRKSENKILFNIDSSLHQKPLINPRKNKVIKKQTETIKKNIDKSRKKITVSIPKYSIERIDTLSSVFEQGKIYVTINANTSYESQRLLCDNLKKRFSEFSNIVICLYTDSEIGKDFANGIGETISSEEQKKVWLAMYTYNSVEGAYFDDNPSGYLSTNN